MDQLRDYRYTIPGIIFGVTFLLGFFHPTTFTFSGSNLSAAVGVLAAALISFSLGYPFTLISGFFVNRFVIPKVAEMNDEYQKQIKAIGKENNVKEDEIGHFISVLHHTLLDQHTIQFLTRRITNIYVAINSILAILGAISLSCGWYWRWCWPYENFETFLFIIFILILALHVRLQFLEYKKMVNLVFPLLILKYRSMRGKPSAANAGLSNSVTDASSP